MQAVVENRCPLINFDEKAETPSNKIAVLLHAQVSVWSGHVCLVKAVFLLGTLLGHQAVSSWLPKSRHLLAGPLPARSVAIIVVRKQMWIHTLERKSVCDCGHVRLHGMAVWVFVCACARVQGVGGWVSESMTWHFLHPVSAPDYGLNAQPCLAILYYSNTDTHTDTAREGW